MKTEIIAVGTELLLGQIANTNAQYVSAKLAENGIDVFYHTCVGDNCSRIKEAIEIASNRAELIILTGGLGPTDDDITKESLANYLTIPLVMHEESLHKIKEFFDHKNKTMPENNSKQALMIDGAKVLRNQFGTAPGLYCEHNQKVYVVLPGPPIELQPMFENELIPLLKSSIGSRDKSVIYSHVLRFFGIGESSLVEKIEDILQAQVNPTIAPLCSDLEVTLRITAKAHTVEAAKEMISPIKDSIISRLEQYYFADHENTLVHVVHKKLLEQGHTIAVAESCTGGLLSSSLTSLPNSSAYFLQGVACYSNESKQQLGVSSKVLESHGAVSSQVAEDLAILIRKKANADLGISITGIAGPTGATIEKPIGLVYISISTGHTIKTEKLTLYGSRDMIRNRAVKFALHLIMKQLDELEKIQNLNEQQN